MFRVLSSLAISLSLLNSLLIFSARSNLLACIASNKLSVSIFFSIGIVEEFFIIRYDSDNFIMYSSIVFNLCFFLLFEV